jgi:hypothetical protein
MSRNEKEGLGKGKSKGMRTGRGSGLLARLWDGEG